MNARRTSAMPAQNFFRTAGWGALLAALVYLLQPLGVLVLVPEATEVGYWADPAHVQDSWWEGPYEVLTFGGIAVGTALLVIALAASVRTTGVASRVATAFGIVGAGGWLAVAGLALAQRSIVAVALSEVGSAHEAQLGDLQATNVVLTGLVGVGALGACVWAVATGIASLRGSGPVGRGIGVLCLIGGIAVLAGAVIPLHPITGALVLIPFYLALGITLLVSARRRRSRAPGAPEELLSREGTTVE